MIYFTITYIILSISVYIYTYYYYKNKIKKIIDDNSELLSSKERSSDSKKYLFEMNNCISEVKVLDTCGPKSKIEIVCIYPHPEKLVTPSSINFTKRRLNFNWIDSKKLIETDSSKILSRDKRFNQILKKH